MKRFPALPAALVLGFLTGEAMGAVLVRDAGLSLLDKNRLLTSAGRAALPGADHLDALAAWPTAFAGGLFFALTLGVGGGALFYAWARAARTLPRVPKRLLQAAAFGPAAVSFGMGANHLAGALLILALIGFFTAEEAEETKGFATALFRAGAVALLLAGFVPWVMGSTDPFVRFRDRFLLSNPVGRSVNDFYYRWTPHAAEVITSLAKKTQPVAALDRGLPAALADALAAGALKIRVIALPDRGHGADFSLVPRDGAVYAERGGVSVPWPSGDEQGMRDALADLSKQTFTARPLWKATGYFLLAGVPLAVALVLFGAARGMAEALAGWFGLGGKTGAVLQLGFVLAASALLALAGMPGPDDARHAEPEKRLAAKEIGEALASPDAAERVHAAVAAGPHARALAPQLLAALDDGVVNVRYNAALALANAPSPETKKRLVELLESDPIWYVRERAYNALWKMGWRP